VREALFNLVGPVDDATVLDLYAGSGALGLEALSRGARRCVFAEADGAACAVIRSNLETLGVTGALVLHRDALAVVREETVAGRHYDLVLLDPPYDTWQTLERRVAASLPAVLAASGLVVVETDARVEPELPLDLVTTRRYGSARLSVFTHPRDP
jgi:16S rRNA (guanine966-N2)-methyltransferase